VTDCPTCAHPMVWCDRLARCWCSVYGDHRAPFADLVRLVMETPDTSRRGIHNRRRHSRSHCDTSGPRLVA
jgi:hypothetical protein